MASGMMAIDVHIGIHIDALEIEAQRLPLVLFAQGECLAIPTLACGQVSAVIARRGVFVEVTLDAPVMWQVH